MLQQHLQVPNSACALLGHPRRMHACAEPRSDGRTAATHAGPTERVPTLLSGMLHLLFTAPRALL